MLLMALLTLTLLFLFLLTDDDSGMTWAEFHQRSTYRFHIRGAHKRRIDSQVVSLFTLSGSALTKASSKHVGEIDPLRLARMWGQIDQKKACQRCEKLEPTLFCSQFSRNFFKFSTVTDQKYVLFR